MMMMMRLRSLLLVIGLSCSVAFVPPVHHTRSKPSSHRPPLAPLHVIDPAVLPDAETITQTTQVMTEAASSAASAAAAAAASASNPGVAGALDAMKSLLSGPSGFGVFGLAALGIRVYTYFTAQSMCARLVTVLVGEGTTVELQYGNSMRNIFYYENKMDKLIVPTGDPKNIDTIRQVIARLSVAAKSNYSIVAVEEDFDDLDMDDGSVDTIVSTYMMNKRKNPAKTFEKAMRLLKDGGAFIFVEPIRGEGLLGGIRQYFGQIHRATNAFGDPGLDFKGIVERWAEGPGREAKMDVEVDVEERNFFLDPHMWGVIYKKDLKGDDYEPTGSEKRKMKRRRDMKSGPKGFEPRQTS